MREKFVIMHMYPELMNLSGDYGNLICLQKRIRDYGYECELRSFSLNDYCDLHNVDMVFMGGGSEREQGLVYNNLQSQAKNLQQEIESGLPALFISGAYQLLGQAYQTNDGVTMPGLGIFNLHTEVQAERLTGNLLIESEVDGQKISVVGFENHSGCTYLRDPNLLPFGKVIKGHGNNGTDASEGLWYKNLIGTYLHGPLLPKNPRIADYFIKAMAARRNLPLTNTLDDTIEYYAHQQIRSKILK